ncbi:MAG: HDOD domain-containing protein [Desulfobacterales bacterium]|nr:HDOD domain-containing protein [Desulfobacterales bacterium]
MTLQKRILNLFREGGPDLPAMSITVQRILSVASNVNSSVEDLEEAIFYDQAITSRLLKLSNSIYYAQKSEVDTIKRAISVIGFDEIIGIVLGMEILSSFNNEADNNLNIGSLWMHSIGVATASKDLADRINHPIGKKIFIPALLHDIGKVFLSVFFKDEYAKIHQLAYDKKRPLYLVENAVLKLNHAILSSLLMKRWKFPESIELPCRFHHSPESSPDEFKLESYTLYLADYVTHKAGIGGRGPVTAKLNDNALKLAGLNQQKVELVIDSLRKKESEIREFFDITTTS